MPFCLELADHLELCIRCCLSQEVIHTSFCRDCGSCHGIVSCDHDRTYAHLAKIGKLLLDTLLDDVLEEYHTQDLPILCNDQRGATLLGYLLYDLFAMVAVASTF